MSKTFETDKEQDQSMRAHVLKRNDQLSKMLKKSEEDNASLLSKIQKFEKTHTI